MNDLDQVRSFRAHLDRTAAEALARAGARVAATGAGVAATGARGVPDGARGVPGGAPPEAPRRWRVIWRVAPPVAAALAVAATAVAIGVSARPVDGIVPPAGTVDPPATGTPAQSAAPSPDAPSARRLINDLAELAESGPPQPDVAPDQLIEVELRYQNTPGAWTTETYRLEAEGLIKSEHELGDRDSFQQYAADQRREFEQAGPSLRQPTAQWLSSLDPSPGRLLELLLEDATCHDCPDGEYDLWQLYNAIADLVRQADVLIPPTVRAGLIRLIGTMPGAGIESVMIEDRPYWALGFNNAGHAATTYAEFYLDPETGRFMGAGTMELRRIVDSEACAAAVGFPVRPTKPPPPACREVAIPVAERERTVHEFWTQRLL
jgi:hypothetical protein